MKQIINFFKDEDGAAIPEYALILGVIAAVASAGLILMGSGADATFKDIGGKISGTTVEP
jgi:Flp pilus assembly pilin Flp